MRIRGAKTEMSELGLDTDGMAESTAKLRSEIMALSGVDIMLDSTTFKSTYQIMEELATKWQDLTDIQQASITELIAGKRQGNIVSSLMMNFDIAQSALQTSLDSSGSAMEEHGKYMDSIEAKLSQLKSAWQGFAQTFMNSDFLKGGIDVLKTIIDFLEKLVDNFGLLGTVGLGAGITGIIQYFRFLKNDGVEAVKIITDVVNAINNITSAVSNVGNAAQTMSNAVESAGDIAEAIGDTAEAIGDTVEAVGDGAEVIGSTIEATGDIVEAVGDSAEAIGDVVEVAGDGVEAMTDLGGAATKTGGSFKAFMKTPMGVASAIGVAIAAIGLLYNAYKNAKEAAAEARQEAIESSDEFLNAAGSFEQAYIKYSGRTDLTAEEEAELESAIKGTVDALGDKSSALHDVVNSSNDYVASLERITDAELKAAEKAAQEKQKNAKLELEDATKDWYTDNTARFQIKNDSTALEIAKEMDTDFLQKESKGKKGYHVSTYWFDMPSDADADKILDYYYTLVEYKNKLLEVDDFDTNKDIQSAYEDVNSVIEKLSETIKVYEDGLYDLAKAEYQAQNGIPKTTEAYLEMREAILAREDIARTGLDTRLSILNSLDSEYANIFDLSSAEAQARKFVGIIEGYGDGTVDGTNEIGTVETFLNMRTAVNNNECSVGDYLDELNNVKSMSEKFSDEEKEQFNLAFGLDTDSIKEQYDDVYNYVKRIYLDKLDGSGMPSSARQEYVTHETQKIKDILDSLSATELQAVANIKGEINWETTNTDEILAQIKDEAKFIEAMNYTIAIDVETESLDALNSSLSESVSGAGLSAESISALKDRYAELASQGYDLSSMFEETSNGIHLNKNAVSEFEQALASRKLSETEDKLKTLKGRYDELTEEIENCTDAGERAHLYSEQQEVAQKINDLATLASQYEGLTSAYNAWQNAESAGNERDMYESIIEGFETIGDEISRGWYDDGTIKFLELMTGQTDLAGKSATELKEIWQDLDKTIEGTSYSVRDFFTTDEDGNSTSTGAYNFLRAVEELGKKGKFTFADGTNLDDLITRNDDGKIVAFDFNVVGGDKAVAEALGVSEEMVQIIQRTLDDAGFVVTLDGKYTLLADLKTSAEEANDVLKKLQAEGLKELKDVDLNFDFNVDTVEGYQEQLEKATTALDKFRDENGKLKTDANGNLVEGAQEALEIAQYYTAAMDKLTEPKFMQIDTSTIEDENIANAIEDMQEIGRLCNDKHLVSLTGDTEELKKVQDEIDKFAKELENLKEEEKIELGIDPNWDYKEIADAIERGEIEIPAELQAELQLDVKMSEDLKDIKLLMMESLGLTSDGEVELKVKYDIDDSTANKLLENGKAQVAIEFIENNKEWFNTLTDDEKKITLDLIADGVDIGTLENKEIVVEFAAKNKDVWDKLSVEEQTVAIKFISENQGEKWFQELSEGEQTVALEIIASGVDLNALEDKEKEVAIKYVEENAGFFNGFEFENEEEREIAIKYAVENYEDIAALSEKEQKVYLKYVSKDESLEELTEEEREVLIKLVTDDEEWFNKLSDENKKIAIRLAVENEDEFNELTDEQKEVVINFAAKNEKWFDELSDTERDIAIRLLVENKDDLDKLTDEQKKVYIEYVAKNKEKFDELSESDKKVFVNYIANGGDVNKFDAELKKRNRNIEIIAETHGVEDVEGLKSAMSGLTDEQVKAIAEAIGKGDVDALDSAVEGMDGNTVKAIANALGYDDVETLKSSIRTMQGKEVPAAVNTDGQAEKINTLQSSILGLDGTTVDVVVNFIKSGWNAVKNWLTGDGVVDGTAHINGTAFSNGTTSGRAFKQGDWGTKSSGVALGAELGPELLVRNGKWHLIGEDGAQFFGYRKGDIIFNADQTREIFEKGKITHGNRRGKALVSGTAFSSGTGGGEEPDFTINYDYNASSDSDSKKSQNIFDWIEVAIERIEREIDNLDKKANNVYKSWSSRNEALADQISMVSNEIELQQNAIAGYEQALSEIDLSQEYIDKIKSGAIEIENITDETLVEKISDYQKYYEKILDCQDAILELKETEAALYAQRFENIQSQYDGILQGYEHTEAMLNEYISQAEEQGYIVSKQYYQALIDNEKSNIAELKSEQADLIAARDEAVASGSITKYSEEWYNMCQEIDSVTQAIEEGATALLEYDNAMREIDWSIFDLIQERISGVTEEADFLIELMSNKELFDDDGKLTSQGLATMGLHAQNYNTHMYAADEYGAEIAKLNEQIADDPYDQELINRRNELLELQRESILAAEDEKNAIRDMVEEGINLELDALQERIDKYNEGIDAAKDLYDYQKDVQEQSEEIASLEKQRAAYLGNDSEEGKAKLQEIEVSLKEAKDNLQETEYDKYISDQQALLDTLYNEYELILNARLDNVDYLLESVIESINAAAGADGNIASALGSEGAIAIAVSNNATSIKDTLTSETNKVGITLSNAMDSIWSTGDGNAKSVLTMYGEDFRTKSTTIITTLNGIKSSVNSMVSSLNKEATTKTNANKTTTSAKKNPTTSSSSSKKTTTAKKASSGDGKPKIGDRVKYVSGQYYYDSQGKKPLGSHKKGEYVYITNINTRGWATHGYHISTGKKLGSGDLGWLKLNQLSGYAVGKKDFVSDEVAWTQENGKEFIVRPSDGAILTPIAKGDSVLNAMASNNIWDMANSPAEFIKDNLGIGSTSVPNNSNVNNSVVQNFENITFSMPNVHGYNDLLREMQSDPKFEKLILSMTIDQIAGKSKLAKGKSIR